MLKKYFGNVKILNLSEKLLLALVFVLPFERIPSVDVSGLTIKLSLLVGLVLIILNLRKTLKNFKGMNHFERLPGVFLELSVLSILWADNLGYWFKANLILGFCIALLYTVICLVRNSNNKDRLSELILKTLLISAGSVMLFGYFQWFGDLLGLPHYLTALRPEYTADKLGLPRMHSVLLEPLYFGLYLLLPLGILWADRAGVVIRSLYFRFAFIAIIYCSILLSLARGAIVASVAVGILGLTYNFSNLKKQLRFKDLARIVLVGLGAFVVLVTATSILGLKGKDEDHNYGRGFSTIVGHLETIKPWGNNEDKAKQDSINSRDEARSEAWGVIKESKKNLLIGVGAGQYGLALVPAKGFEATSNFVGLDIWAELGIFGLILVLIFFIKILVLALKSRGSLDGIESIFVIGVALYLVGYLVQSISFGELSITHLWVALALACSVLFKEG